METPEASKSKKPVEKGLNIDLIPSPPNILISRFKELQNLCEEPKRDETLWKQCWQRAKRQLRREEKRRLAKNALASGLGSSGGGSSWRKKPPEPSQMEIRQRAAQLYEQENPDYIQALDRLCEEMIPLAKEIHRIIFAEKANLRGFREAKDTLLFKDWWQISQHLSVDEILSFERAGLFGRTIDALEVIKQTHYWKAYAAAFVKELQELQQEQKQTASSGKAGGKKTLASKNNYEPAVVLDAKDRKILAALNRYNQLVNQIDLESDSLIGLSRKTIGKRLPLFKKAGYICYPKGKSGGISITDLGKKVLLKPQKLS